MLFNTGISAVFNIIPIMLPLYNKQIYRLSDLAEYLLTIENVIIIEKDIDHQIILLYIIWDAFDVYFCIVEQDINIYCSIPAEWQFKGHT